MDKNRPASISRFSSGVSKITTQIPYRFLSHGGFSMGCSKRSIYIHWHVPLLQVYHGIPFSQYIVVQIAPIFVDLKSSLCHHFEKSTIAFFTNNTANPHVWWSYAPTGPEIYVFPIFIAPDCSHGNSKIQWHHTKTTFFQPHITMSHTKTTVFNSKTQLFTLELAFVMVNPRETTIGNHHLSPWKWWASGLGLPYWSFILGIRPVFTGKKSTVFGHRQKISVFSSIFSTSFCDSTIFPLVGGIPTNPSEKWWS